MITFTYKGIESYSDFPTPIALEANVVELRYFNL